MAAGGIDVEVDSRVQCSICLEPYRERQPKILPCFHTFCLPCLTGLVTRETETCDSTGQDTEEESGRSAVSLTCPTCRSSVTVPAGGAEAFQTNFYLDVFSKEEDPQPEPCSLCDGDQTAEFQCGKCLNSFCSRCQRAHDKLCQASQVAVLEDPSKSSCPAQSVTRRQVKEQLQMVEDALKTLKEEEFRMNQERQAMDYSINVRYGTLLRHGAEARDACLVSLREVYDGLTERLHSHIAEAQHARDTLQQELSPSQPAPVSASQSRAALFLQGDLQTILKGKMDCSSLLKHQTEENTSVMINTLRSFMGKVVESNQPSGPPGNQEASGSLQGRSEEGHVSLEGADSRSLNDLYQKFEDLMGRVTTLQSTTTQLAQQLNLLTDSNSRLPPEPSTLQREVADHKDASAKLTSALQGEVAALKDKNAIVHQDLALLKTEKDQACADLATLQQAVNSMEGTVYQQQTDITKLKSDHRTAVNRINGVEGDVYTLQKDADYLKRNVKSLESDYFDLRSNMAKVNKSRSGFAGWHVPVKANTQVAFCASLSEEVLTDQKRALTFDQIICNVGGGCDRP